MIEFGALRFIRCWSGGDVYALDMKWVRTVQRVDRLIQNSDERGERGWLDIGGVDVPVWALADRMETAVSTSPPSIDGTERIIVLNDERGTWGVLVDRVSQVMSVEQTNIFPMPQIAVNQEKPYFSGVLLLNEQLLLRLHPGALHPDALHLDAETELLDLGDRSETAGVNGRLSDKRGQIILFQLPRQGKESDKLSFALSITQVPEVLEASPVMQIANAPSYVNGLIKWREQPVVMIDLGEWLGTGGGDGRFPSDEQSHLRLMIVRQTGGGGLIGFWVRPSVQILQLPLPHQPVNNESMTVLFEPKRVRGIISYEGRLIIIPMI